jgi:inorganic triphosphatase YgiF
VAKSRATEQEVESALIAVSENVQTLRTKLAALRELDGWLLTPRADENIVDEYVDTADERLGSRHVALRVRRLDGSPRLTLKGPTRRRSGAASTRFEIERPWSTRAAQQALRGLVDLGVPLARRTASRAWRSPEDFTRALGLEPRQRRETTRQPRDVYRKEASTGRPLAELALDTVTYSIGRRKVRVFEVEVEAKRRDGVEAADRVTQRLLESWAGLRPWRHSKLATGLALEALEGQGKLADLVATGGFLTPRGIEALSRQFGRTSL